jgi:FecR-like protein
VSEENLSGGAAELARLARKTLGHMTEGQHARGLEAVRGHAHRRRAERRRRLMAIGGATAAMAIAAFALAPRVLQRMHAGPPPLALQVESGAIDAAGAIVPRQGDATARPALRFEDGTVIKLGNETRGRLGTVDGHGAQVAIENGSAHVSVVHKPKARWLINAGPYLITVHGTVFSASWDESQQRLDVKMERGLVSVSGPVTNGPIAVRAGQALTVKLKRSQVLLRDLNGDDVVASLDADADADLDAANAGIAPPSVAPAATAPAVRTRVASLQGKATRQARPKTWTAALSAGDFDFIVEEAERDIGHTLATRGTEDLAALADAARYRRHDDVARRALLAQRRRFAGSPRAADAAFFLGRLDENGGRGHGPALAWYERYLDEAPRGSYVAEALGRKMIAVEEIHGAAAARNVAEQYLRRFPRGSYAGAARALLGAR